MCGNYLSISIMLKKVLKFTMQCVNTINNNALYPLLFSILNIVHGNVDSYFFFGHFSVIVSISMFINRISNENKRRKHSIHVNHRCAIKSAFFRSFIICSVLTYYITKTNEAVAISMKTHMQNTQTII